VTAESVGAMPAGSVVITPTDMYAEIRTMGRQIDHLADVLDPAITDIREDIRDVRTVAADHEGRIRTIEQQMWRWVGMAAVCALVVSAAVAYIVSVR